MTAQHEKNSLAELLASLPSEEQQSAIHGLTDAQASSLLHDWRFWSRADQLPPVGDWRNWLILSGRGWGKTRTGSEFVRAEVDRLGPGTRVAIIGQTTADVRMVMIQGESGLLVSEHTARMHGRHLRHARRRISDFSEFIGGLPLRQRLG